MNPADAPLWLLELALDTQAEELPEVEFSANGHTEKPDLGLFQIHELIRSTIKRAPEPDEDRSSIDQSVINALVRAGASDDEILAVYQHYPIGTAGKYADKGKWGADYLRRTIAKARKYVGKHPPDEGAESRAFLLSASADHEGHAQCVLRLHPGEFAYTGETGWMVNTGTHYQAGKSAEAAVQRAIVDTLIDRRVAGVRAEDEALVKATRANRYNVTGTQALLQSLVTVSISDFDDDPDLLNCKNGVVHLPTGKLVTHDPGQRFTYCLETPFDPEALATAHGVRWNHQVLTSTGDNLDTADYLQIAAGYSISGRIWEEILIYVFGPARAGKGTFTEPILKTLGRPLSTTLEFQSLTAQRYGDTQNFDLAGLKATRFVVASESHKYQPLNTQKIKSLTGGDHVRAAFKHRDLFEYRPQFKLWLLSNHPVNLDPDDTAAWSRIRVIHFPRSYLGREDKRLKHELKKPDSLKAILAWLVAGAERWYQSPNGLVAPKSITAATAEQRDQADFVGQWIAETCDTGGADAFIASGTAYREYKMWSDSNGITPKKQRQFSQALIAKGFEATKKYVGDQQQRGFAGLSLKK